MKVLSIDIERSQKKCIEENENKSEHIICEVMKQASNNDNRTELQQYTTNRTKTINNT